MHIGTYDTYIMTFTKHITPKQILLRLRLSAASSYCWVECLKHWEDFCKTAATVPGSAPAGTGQGSSRWPTGRADRTEILHPVVPMFVPKVPVSDLTIPENSVCCLPRMRKRQKTTLPRLLVLVAALEAAEAFAIVSAAAPECVSAPRRLAVFVAVLGRLFAVVRGPPSGAAREEAFVAAASALVAEV